MGMGQPRAAGLPAAAVAGLCCLVCALCAKEMRGLLTPCQEAPRLYQLPSLCGSPAAVVPCEHCVALPTTSRAGHFCRLLKDCVLLLTGQPGPFGRWPTVLFG